MRNDVAEHISNSLLALVKMQEIVEAVREFAALVGDANVQDKVNRRTRRGLRAFAKAHDACLEHILDGNVRTNKNDRDLLATQRKAIDTFLGRYEEREVIGEAATD